MKKNRQDFPKAEKEAFIYKCPAAQPTSSISKVTLLPLGLSFLEDLGCGKGHSCRLPLRRVYK